MAAPHPPPSVRLRWKRCAVTAAEIPDERATSMFAARNAVGKIAKPLPRERLATAGLPTSESKEST